MTYFQCALSSAALLWSVSLTYPRRLFVPPVRVLTWPALSADWASTSVVSSPQNYILLSAWSACWSQFPMVPILAPVWGQGLGLIRQKLLEHFFIASLQKASPAAEIPTKYFSYTVILSVSYLLPPFAMSWMGLIIPDLAGINATEAREVLRLWRKGILSSYNRYIWTFQSLWSVRHSTHFCTGIRNGLAAHSARDRSGYHLNGANHQAT